MRKRRKLDITVFIAQSRLLHIILNLTFVSEYGFQNNSVAIAFGILVSPTSQLQFLQTDLFSIDQEKEGSCKRIEGREIKEKIRKKESHLVARLKDLTSRLSLGDLETLRHFNKFSIKFRNIGRQIRKSCLKQHPLLRQ